jgi:hypothetical protein
VSPRAAIESIAFGGAIVSVSLVVEGGDGHLLHVLFMLGPKRQLEQLVANPTM